MFVDHMHQPWRTLAVIINKYLSGKIASNDKLRKSRIDILWGMFYKENVDYPELIWEDLAFQIDHRKEKRSRREDYQAYGLAIPEVMLNDAIKQSESYQMFIKYFTDVALELRKSISLTKVEEVETTRKVHATHARIVSESVPESAKKKFGGRSSRGAQSLTPAEKEAANIMQALKESNKTSKRQLGIGGSSEGTSTMLGVPDESTIVSATSSEGTGTKPGVPGEEKDITKENVILDWGSEQESEYSKEDQLDDQEKNDKEGDADDEGNDHISDTQDTNDEDDEIESDEDEIYKYKIRVRKDEDEEMLNAEVEYFGKGDAKVSDTDKTDAEKTEEAKDDYKKAKLPPTSSSLSISSGFGDQFLKLSSDTSLVVLTPVQETPSAALVITLPLPSVSTTPLVPQQTTTPISPPPITTDALIITFVVPKSDALSVVQLRVAKLEKDVSGLKKINLSVEALVALKTQVPSIVDNYLGSKVGDVFQKELKKHTVYLIQKYSLQQIPELLKNQTPTVDLEKKYKKIPSEILKIKKEQVEKQKMPKFTIKSTDKAALNELYHALIEVLIEDENAMDKGFADTVQDHKRKHDDGEDDDGEDDDDEDPPARPNQGKKTKRRRTIESESSKNPSTTKETPKGKASSKGSKTDKSASAKESVEEPTTEVVMDDAGEEVVRDDDQP
ncbi:hypothetical protein Tco_1076484 [Tanacetum coccineum]